VVSGGTSLEAIAGVGTVVLAVLGLAGVLPVYLTAIAAIVAAAGLLLGGGAGASRLHYLRAHAASNATFAELSSGISAEFVGGFAGIVLGILALIGILPAVLLPVAVLTLGGSLLIGAGATSRLNRFAALGPDQSDMDVYAREAAAAGAQVLVGLGALALGVLALVGIASMTLTLVALLAIGAATFLSGATLTGRLQAALHGHA
jgi:hypothetical protein